ncbi:MAG: wax ester/triacylglycerol synthase family O-acyltransferase [Thiogranum sp.]
MVKQLSGQDRSFLDMERMGLPQHVTSVAIYDQKTAPGGKVRFKQILEHLESRLHLSPLFHSKLQNVPAGLDNPYLVDDPGFDIEYHVRHIALPKPGDWRQLCIMMARINARPLDMTRPLWEVYVIEGLDSIEHIPTGCFALLIRVHHSLMDGASGAQMIAAIHDLSPEASKREKESAVIHKAPSQMAMYGRAYANALRKPQRMLHLGRRFIDQQRARKDKGMEGAKRMVDTRFNKPEMSPHRVLDALTLDFAEVRTIKNTLEGATVNDVMLTLVGGALRRYLKAKDELPEVNLTCGCPIDVRTDDERDSGGNLVGFMGVNLHTEIEDPWERFIATRDASAEGKQFAHASDVRINQQVYDAVPGGLLTTAIRASVAIGTNIQPFNTMLTNVPGPPCQLYFAGAELVDGFGIGPLIPWIGLFHTASSAVQNKVGKINLSFWADREMMPDPEFYRQCIEESYQELLDLASS